MALEPTKTDSEMTQSERDDRAAAIADVRAQIMALHAAAQEKAQSSKK